MSNNIFLCLGKKYIEVLNEIRTNGIDYGEFSTYFYQIKKGFKILGDDFDDLSEYAKINRRNRIDRDLVLKALRFDEDKEIHKPPRKRKLNFSNSDPHDRREKSERIRRKGVDGLPPCLRPEANEDRPTMKVDPITPEKENEIENPKTPLFRLKRDNESILAFRSVNGKTPDLKGKTKIDLDVVNKLVHLLANICKISLTTSPPLSFWIDFVKKYGRSGMNMIPTESADYLRKLWKSKFCTKDGQSLHLFEANGIDGCRFCNEICPSLSGVKNLELLIVREASLGKFDPTDEIRDLTEATITNFKFNSEGVKSRLFEEVSDNMQGNLAVTENVDVGHLNTNDNHVDEGDTFIPICHDESVNLDMEAEEGDPQVIPVDSPEEAYEDPNLASAALNMQIEPSDPIDSSSNNEVRKMDDSGGDNVAFVDSIIADTFVTETESDAESSVRENASVDSQIEQVRRREGDSKGGKKCLSEKVKKCPTCGIDVLSKHLKRHLVNHDKDELNDNVKICPFCNKIVSALRLKEHMKGKMQGNPGCAIKHNFVPFLKRGEMSTPKNKLMCSKCRSFLSLNTNLKRHEKNCKGFVNTSQAMSQDRTVTAILRDLSSKVDKRFNKAIIVGNSISSGGIEIPSQRIDINENNAADQRGLGNQQDTHCDIENTDTIISENKQDSSSMREDKVEYMETENNLSSVFSNNKVSEGMAVGGETSLATDSCLSSQARDMISNRPLGVRHQVGATGDLVAQPTPNLLMPGGTASGLEETDRSKDDPVKSAGFPGRGDFLQSMPHLDTSYNLKHETLEEGTFIEHTDHTNATTEPIVTQKESNGRGDNLQSMPHLDTSYCFEDVNQKGGTNLKDSFHTWATAAPIVTQKELSGDSVYRSSSLFMVNLSPYDEYLFQNLSKEQELHGRELNKNLNEVFIDHPNVINRRNLRKGVEGRLVQVVTDYISISNGKCWETEAVKLQGYVSEVVTPEIMIGHLERRIIPFLRTIFTKATDILDLDDANFIARLLTNEHILQLNRLTGSVVLGLIFKGGGRGRERGSQI